MEATSFWLPIAVPALVTRSPIVRGTGAAAPSDRGLRAPYYPAS